QCAVIKPVEQPLPLSWQLFQNESNPGQDSAQRSDCADHRKPVGVVINPKTDGKPGQKDRYEILDQNPRPDNATRSVFIFRWRIFARHCDLRLRIDITATFNNARNSAVLSCT